MTKATQEALDFIQQAGFHYLKFELEADIGRDGERECQSCYGEGHTDCDSCNGEGATEVEEYIGNAYRDNWVECEDCSGDGDLTCDDCGGEGNLGDYYSEDTCQQFMRDYVPAEVNERLIYGHFYDDGSVDSEFTFTIAVEHFADFQEWLKAFVALAEVECNSSLDVNGAGMHITLLTNSDYNNRPQLPRSQMNNFRREVTKLLPALFFVASAGHQSRELSYRMPRISSDDKYSAIYTHGDSCLEYRLFETCYDRPEAVNEYMQAIANTLRFYTDSSLTVRSLGQEFGFNNDNSSVARFYNTPEQLRILNATIKEVKPKDKTFKKLRADRGVNYTIKALTIEDKKKMAQLRVDYRQYRYNWEKALNDPLTPDEQREYDMHITEMGRSPETARMRIRGLSQIYRTFEDFVRDNSNNRILRVNTVRV